MEIDAISIRSFDSSMKKTGMAAGSTTKLQCCCDSATDQSFLAVQSYIDSNFDETTDSDRHSEKTELMLDKKIKFLVFNHKDSVSLITEDIKKYQLWTDTSSVKYEGMHERKARHRPDIIDWSNTRIVKTAFTFCNIIVLTDDGKIYYLRPFLGKNAYENFIRQMVIEEKITCIACTDFSYVVVTDKGEVYEWTVEFGGSSTIEKPRKKIELSGKTIVKVVCGSHHTLALTDKGEVYGWGASSCGQLNTSEYISLPIMINIPHVTKVLDIAALDKMSAIKSDDGLVYICGKLYDQCIKEFVTCEYTNIFDICNSMMAQSPVFPNHAYTNEESLVLKDLEAAFNDHSTSDVKIEVEGKYIYVHKTILKIRSTYFRNMFRFNGTEDNQNVIKCEHHKYVVYEAYLKYLYIGVINLSSLDDMLDLMILADEYCEVNLETDCIRIIKKKITKSNVLHVKKMAIRYNKKDLEEYCSNFIKLWILTPYSE